MLFTPTSFNATESILSLFFLLLVCRSPSELNSYVYGQNRDPSIPVDQLPLNYLILWQVLAISESPFLLLSAIISMLIQMQRLHSHQHYLLALAIGGSFKGLHSRSQAVQNINQKLNISLNCVPNKMNLID